MRYFFLLLVVATITCQGQSNPRTERYPSKLWSANDTFIVKFSYMPSYKFQYRVSAKDTVDMGTDGAVGLFAIIYTGNDSTRFDYTNLPYDQSHWITIESPKGKTMYHLHFNQVRSAFSDKYIKENTGSVQVLVPEVYELANIIWTLSPAGQKADNLNKHGSYYNSVVRYFNPYLKHPIFQKLRFDEKDYLNNYYDFRENSFPFSFSQNRIVIDGPYYYVHGNDRNFNSLFKQLLPMVEDFAMKSRYRNFYNQNRKYYSQQVERAKELLPITKMWDWLEKRFPEKYASYKVVFSPLIKSSHSTQNFSTAGKPYKETVMFVARPENIDEERELTEKQKVALSSGIVFTEIDHNYVNPVSNRYQKLIDSIFSKRDIWTSQGGDVDFYPSPMSIFNEYMTHGTYSLYLLDNYDSTTANFAIKKRESLMVEHRHYIKFREFNKVLINLYRESPSKNIAQLFPAILNWCKLQTGW